MNKTLQILQNKNFSKDNLVYLLSLNKEQAKELFEFSAKVKQKSVGNKVFFRGIIEFSNVCRKNCLYCGIRKGNKNVLRYDLDDKQIIDRALYAYDIGLGSIVLQSGERNDTYFIKRIEKLLKIIKQKTNNGLGITLSVGEQSYQTYLRWFEAGAHRYLLRIEVSNPNLYKKYHPNDDLHRYDVRLKCLYDLKKIGYQTGTGVMIGLPFQSIEDLADDLLFFKNFDIDMVGMGPYIEHKQTPLYKYADKLLPLEERLFLTFKMIAILRILMPDINIAATTALQAIDPMGREKAIKIGANVLMPNITPSLVRKNYFLYENKPCTEEGADDCLDCLVNRLKMVDAKPVLNQWGDSLHFFRRKKYQQILKI